MSQACPGPCGWHCFPQRGVISERAQGVRGPTASAADRDAEQCLPQLPRTPLVTALHVGSEALTTALTCSHAVVPLSTVQQIHVFPVCRGGYRVGQRQTICTR